LIWKKFKDEKPTPNELVLIFRVSNKKYNIARYTWTDGDAEKCIEYSDEWVTQYNTCHNVDPHDLWVEFEHLSFSETKEYK
jgi:hypothetical protein